MNSIYANKYFIIPTFQVTKMKY